MADSQGRGEKRKAEPQELGRQSIYEWTREQVTDFFRSLDLGAIDLEVDGPTLAELGEADLKELLPELGLLSRKKLAGHINRLRLAVHGPKDEAVDASQALQALPLPAPEPAEVTPEEDISLKALDVEKAELDKLSSSFIQAAETFKKKCLELPETSAKGFVEELLAEVKAALSASTACARVPIFGTTGAGKSTLMNALLRQHVVPTSGWRSCTAVPVELSTCSAQSFRGEVHLKTVAEWTEEVGAAVQDLLMSDRTRVSRREPTRGSSPTPQEAAYDLLRAVFPTVFAATSSPWPSKAAALAELLGTRNRVTRKHAEAQVLHFEHEDGERLAHELLDFVDSPDEELQAAFWPLVRKVKILCPAAVTHGHPNVILVDAPGVQDANAARGNVVKKLLEEASSVVIVSAIKRAATERVAQEMLSERFRRQLLMDGHYGRLAFVASCTDDLTLSELRRNLKIKEELSTREAALLRNERTKEKITSDCLAGVRRIEAQGEQATRSTDEELRSRGIAPAVFTTSARDYQKLSGLLDTAVDGPPQVWSSVEETEIPQFRRWLHAQGQKTQLAALAEAEARLAAVCRKLQEPAETEASVWDDQRLRQELQAMKETQVQVMRQLISQRLLNAVGLGQRTAAEEAARTMGARCQPRGQGGVHHATFKATVQRHGEWREDFNELLADPLNRRIAIEWDRCLNQELPQHVDELLRRISSELWRLQADGRLPAPPFQEAEDVVKIRCGPQLKRQLQAQQMELSRQIKETIKSLMGASYASATNQCGVGMDLRQKAIIRTQVADKGQFMFQKASNFIHDHLDRLLSCLEKGLEELLGKVALALAAAFGRLQAVGTERQNLQAVQAQLGPTAVALLQGCEERQRRRVRLEHSAVEAEVQSKTKVLVPASPSHEFMCPITQEVMKDPVSTCDGHSYERHAIEEWLQCHETSPVTGLRLANKNVIPNHSLSKLIKDHEAAIAQKEEAGEAMQDIEEAQAEAEAEAEEEKEEANQEEEADAQAEDALVGRQEKDEALQEDEEKEESHEEEEVGAAKADPEESEEASADEDLLSFDAEESGDEDPEDQVMVDAKDTLEQTLEEMMVEAKAEEKAVEAKAAKAAPATCEDTQGPRGWLRRWWQ